MYYILYIDIYVIYIYTHAHTHTYIYTYIYKQAVCAKRINVER